MTTLAIGTWYMVMKGHTHVYAEGIAGTYSWSVSMVMIKDTVAAIAVGVASFL